METSDLSELQQRHVKKYDEMQEVVNDVDFDHYSTKRFGPWNPYWCVHNYVERYYSHPGQKLLTFGCGSGIDALRYARMGYQVYGFDISQRRIRVAQALAAKYGYEGKTQFSVQPAENLDYASDFFDIVVGVNVLHHIDVEESMKQVAKVLKKGGRAIFKEPLQTPARDRIRNSRLVTWLIPKNVKSIPKKLKYSDVEGEHKLNDRDFAIVRRHFSRLTIKRWRVLALLSFLMANKPFLEKCDWLLFRALPFVRRLGDQAVLVIEND
ncbi:MAG: class I SAM-dependent methyltransferase [Planctomycetota bacterium]